MSQQCIVSFIVSKSPDSISAAFAAGAKAKKTPRRKAPQKLLKLPTTLPLPTADTDAPSAFFRSNASICRPHQWKMMKTHNSFILSFFSFQLSSSILLNLCRTWRSAFPPKLQPYRLLAQRQKKYRWISMNFRRDVKSFEKSSKKSQSAELNTLVWTSKNLDYVIMYYNILIYCQYVTVNVKNHWFTFSFSFQKSIYFISFDFNHQHQSQLNFDVPTSFGAWTGTKAWTW